MSHRFSTDYIDLFVEEENPTKPTIIDPDATLLSQTSQRALNRKKWFEIETIHRPECTAAYSIWKLKKEEEQIENLKKSEELFEKRRLYSKKVGSECIEIGSSEIFEAACTLYNLFKEGNEDHAYRLISSDKVFADAFEKLFSSEG